MAKSPIRIRRPPPAWLRGKRAGKPAGAARYESSLARQARVLEAHEKRVADHTALQSSTAIVGLIVSILTTVVLIWVAYQQYRTADRQVRLEYAKVEPSFTVSVEVAPNTTYVNNAVAVFDLPRRVRVIASRGDAVVEKVEFEQDVGGYVSNLRDVVTNRDRCNLTVENLFSSTNGGLEAVLSPEFSRKISGSSFRGPLSRYIGLHMDALWVEITYRDVFNETRKVLLKHEDGLTSVIASGKKDHIFGPPYHVLFNSSGRGGNLFQGYRGTVPETCQAFTLPPTS